MVVRAVQGGGKEIAGVGIKEGQHRARNRER